MSDQKSEFNIDEGRNVFAKLGRTLLMLIIGLFFGLFTVLVWRLAGNGWWALALKITVDTCWTFWGLGLLYI